MNSWSTKHNYSMSETLPARELNRETGSDELLSCPFCGDAMELRPNEVVRHKIVVNNCPISSSYFNSSLWNKRAPLTATNTKDLESATRTTPGQSREQTGTPFAWNPEHLATCVKCGEEMVYNVPRLAENGGYVHKKTGAFLCGGEQQQISVPLTSSHEPKSTVEGENKK